MIDIVKLRKELETKNDIEWFDAMCNILRRDQTPTTKKLSEFLGVEKPNPKHEIRGSKFIDPFDNRFDRVAINPILSNNEIDNPIDYISFSSFHEKKLKLKSSDIISRFPFYRTQLNTYDGGTQFFFYPVPEYFEFTALDFWTEKESEEIKNPLDLIFNGVAFGFGNKLTLGRDGYNMKR